MFNYSCEIGGRKGSMIFAGTAIPRECVGEGQLRGAGVEGVKTTQKIQRYRPMVRDVIADTQAEQGGVVHFEPGAEFREINGVAEQILGAPVGFPGSLPVPGVFGVCRTAAG